VSEPHLWTQLRRHLTPFGRLVRVENRCEPGTPDVAYCLQDGSHQACGWIELKYLRSWPAKAETPVRFPELTLEQVLWHAQWPHGSWLLAKVGGSYLLLPGQALRPVYMGLPAAQLSALATWHAGPRFPTGLLLRALTGLPTPRLVK
jgi:hypothetical protein